MAPVEGEEMIRPALFSAYQAGNGALAGGTPHRTAAEPPAAAQR